jgi:hypothetical protein
LRNRGKSPKKRLKDPQEKANRILKLLLVHSTENYDPECVGFADLLKELEKGFYKKSQQEIKSIKMRYHHHIKPLIDRKLIELEPQGREKRFRLTEQGIIFAIIVSTLPL